MNNHLRILSAGAGAGKTYSLSEAIVEAISNGVPAERIMATTFTTKAAKELTERVRQRLLAAGHPRAASLFLDGYVGTMNSVFGRLLREFALELGLSPEQTVLPEEQARTLFQTVVAQVIDAYYRRYQSVFNRLQMENWRDTVHDIINKARQNGMDFEAVRNCADSSWELLETEVLPIPLEDGRSLDATFRRALMTVAHSVSPADTTKKTKTALETLSKILSDWNHRGYLYWQEWAQASKVSPAKKSEEDFAFVIETAAVHDRHPQLHRDLKEAISALFHCAADAMEMYADEKAKRGLVDFTDQEALALSLLSEKSCEDALRDRISHVFVDEFQDSSPLQLALITRLLDLARESTWVGDVKQAIFGFRGTDPSLMTAAMEHVDEANIRVLGDSYRSRSSLVSFVNSVFVPVFRTIGMKAEQVALNPKRLDKPGQATPLETWIYKGAKNRDDDVLCLARGVRNMLADSDHHLVEDPFTGELRAIRPSDVAILCRSNDECQRLADVLSSEGIRATVGKGGLLSTPEATIAMSAFRYLVDDGDTLALAELLHLSTESWGNGRFLERWLQVDDPRRAFALEPQVLALDSVREKITHMSPAEAWDLAVSSASIPRLVLGWGEGDKRLANLEALKSLVVQYEDACGINGIAATSSGLLLFLRDVQQSDGDLNRIADSYDEGAVNVLTYHKSKGLEWPVVILSSLQSSSHRNGPPLVFNQTMAVTPSDVPFDVMNPLRGRSLLYWPWPYGGQRTDVGLDARVDGLPLLNSAKRLALLENIRLLYVGMTRARDYLIFATRQPSQAHWLDELKDERGVNLIALPDSATDETQPSDPFFWTQGHIRTEKTEFSCVVRILETEEEAGTNVPEAHERDGSSNVPADLGSLIGAQTVTVEKSLAAYVAATKPGIPAEFLPARFQPSKAAEMAARIAIEGTSRGAFGEGPAAFGVRNEKVIEMGGRIPITGHVEMSLLGDMVHAFLAADNAVSARVKRLELADGMRETFGIYAITAEAMVDASDRLTQFLKARYPDVSAVHKEWPMHVRMGNVKASGWMDLVLETHTGWVIVDHKTFPGKVSSWEDKAKGYLPQLQVYASALQAATGKPVREAWIHMPVVGVIIGFDDRERASSLMR